jgi:rhodanese-related sulfurtransferase
MEIKRITPEQTKEPLDSNQDYIYLDVRTVPEFEAGHVPGAKNVPVVEPDASGACN